jgi:alkylation response protein AidB-like acyl-CoA dehydrogenase
MNFELSQDQQLMRDTFARFLNEESSVARVRAALPSGFDQAMWTGLAELGAFGLRVPRESGGLGLGVLDAAVEPLQWVAGGAVAEAVIARDGGNIVLIPVSQRTGPAGFLNQCYRHAQGTTIYGGTSEIHRSMIAERALQLPRTRA